MNAAARALNESLVIAARPTHVRRIILSRHMLFFLALIFAALASTLSLITVIDKNRIEVGVLASLEQNQNDLMTSYNELLLEENTWASPVRVEEMAKKRFGMLLPDPKQVVLIQH